MQKKTKPRRARSSSKKSNLDKKSKQAEPCYCAETSSRNCPRHQNQNETNPGDEYDNWDDNSRLLIARRKAKARLAERRLFAIILSASARYPTAALAWKVAGDAQDELDKLEQES